MGWFWFLQTAEIEFLLAERSGFFWKLPEFGPFAVFYGKRWEIVGTRTYYLRQMFPDFWVGFRLFTTGKYGKYLESAGIMLRFSGSGYCTLVPSIAGVANHGNCAISVRIARENVGLKKQEHGCRILGPVFLFFGRNESE